MKILVVTGLLAEAAVQKSVGDLADVLVLPIPVAALITPQKLISGFFDSAFSKNKYDAVLVSGFSKFNFSKAETELGCSIYLGPKHAVDLKTALSFQLFSKSVPACELIKNQKKEQAYDILKECEKSETPAFYIGSDSIRSANSVSIGGNSRMKILAEIVAAESLSKTELQNQINYLVSEGADIIDIGFSPDADTESVSMVMAFAKSVCSVPVSIDAGTFLQIISGIANADLVLSIDSRILDEYSQLLAKKELPASYPIFDRVVFVVIPDLFSDEDRLKTLEQNIAAAKQFGMKKIIADPILSPPGKGLFPSLSDYYEFHQRNPDVPILFGAGNVTELFDADSVGMNALLSEIAEECGASVLFTPNASDKGKGSVCELRRASEMIVLSNARDSSPKDLGLDLLILKEKRKRPDFNMALISKSGAFDSLHLRNADLNCPPFDSEINSEFDSEIGSDVGSEINSEIGSEINSDVGSEMISSGRAHCLNRYLVLSGSLSPDFTAETKWGWKSDSSGNFLIGVLPVSDLIPYLIDSCGFDENSAEIQKLKSVGTAGGRVIAAVHQKAIVVGIDSAFMLESILNNNLISELSHAGYLGRELQKAEIAVRLGRSYAQDDIF